MHGAVMSSVTRLAGMYPQQQHQHVLMLMRMPLDAQAAVEDYTLVLELNPNNVNALIQRADAHCVLDEHQVCASFSCVTRQRDWRASG